MKRHMASSPLLLPKYSRDNMLSLHSSCPTSPVFEQIQGAHHLPKSYIVRHDLPSDILTRAGGHDPGCLEAPSVHPVLLWNKPTENIGIPVEKKLPVRQYLWPVLAELLMQTH
jgi:hypothetical protein